MELAPPSFRQGEPVVPPQGGKARAAGLTGGSAASSRPHPHPRPSGAFTLIELLTVIAVVGVLATLLLSAVGSAKKRGRQARCTSNLRQISLALNMYLDDFDRRPSAFDPVVGGRYLAAAGALLCPEDRTGNWGGLVNPLSLPIDPATMLSQNRVGAEIETGMAPPVTDASLAAGAGLAPESAAIAAAGEMTPPDAAALPFSYLHPLSWEIEAWNQLQEKGGSAGLATCQLHGLGRAHPETPSLRDFEGLILRAQRDGAVVRRKVYWGAPNPGAEDSTSMKIAAPSAPAPAHPWPLFTDETAP